jgi:hypothetical protein
VSLLQQQQIMQLKALKKRQEESLQVQLGQQLREKERVSAQIKQIETEIEQNHHNKQQFIHDFYFDLTQKNFSHQEMYSLDIGMKNYDAEANELAEKKQELIIEAQKLAEAIRQTRKAIRTMIIKQEKYDYLLMQA